MISSVKVRAVVEHLASVNPYTNVKDLPDVPRPEEMPIPRELPSILKLPYVQNILVSLSYNFLPQTFFCLEKHRSLESILLTSKEILTEALPIRCLEATFVGLYLTHGMKDVDRIPLSFKSRAKGRRFHHIVLVTRCNSLYGALGLSRKSTLMNKPMVYRSLFDLIMEYKKQYEVIGHELLDFKLGLCVSHETHSQKPPCWRYIAVSLVRTNLPLRSASPHSGGEGGGCENNNKSSFEVDAAAAEEPNILTDVSELLSRYTALLSRMSMQYEKYSVPLLPGASRDAHPTCLKDLHEMEETVAREENRRRLENVRNGRSPCHCRDMSAKKRAASRSVSNRRAKFDSRTSIAAGRSVTKRVVQNKKNSSKKDTNASDELEQHEQQEEEREDRKLDSPELPQRIQQTETQQLPLVTESTSPLLSPTLLSVKFDSSGSGTQKAGCSNHSPFLAPTLPFLETKSSGIDSLIDSSCDYWDSCFRARQDLNGMNFHDFL